MLICVVLQWCSWLCSSGTWIVGYCLGPIEDCGYICSSFVFPHFPVGDGVGQLPVTHIACPGMAYYKNLWPAGFAWMQQRVPGFVINCSTIWAAGVLVSPVLSLPGPGHVGVPPEPWGCVCDHCEAFCIGSAVWKLMIMWGMMDDGYHSALLQDPSPLSE